MKLLTTVSWGISLVLLVSGCSVTRPYQPKQLAEPASAGTWLGTLRCSRENVYATRLTFWETEPNRFQGKMSLQSVKGSGLSSEYPIRGYKQTHGTISLSPNYKGFRRPNYKVRKLRISISARLDPGSKKIIASITRGCHSNLYLNPVSSAAVDSLVVKHGKYDYKTQKKRDLIAKREKSIKDCAVKSAQKKGRMARYFEQSNPLAAPAFRKGLFVYKHNCLSLAHRKTQLIYSKTAPDDPGDDIEVFSGPFEKGVFVSRRDVSILSLSQVCKLFEYSVVAGRRFYCVPYGWRYTGFVRKQCFGGATRPSGVRGALGCQIMVMGGTIKPFERGPKQRSPR